MNVGCEKRTTGRGEGGETEKRGRRVCGEDG